MRTALLALFPLLQIVFVSPSLATTANDICPAAADPCVVPVVKGGFPVTSGSILDFGTRSLRVPAGAQLNVTGSGGSMTISAGAVDIQATSGGAGSLRAVGGQITVTATTGDVNVRKMGNSTARIDASGDPASGGGGEIDITASAGNILVDGVLDAGANAADQDGGVVSLTAIGVTLGAASEVDVNSKGAGSGGVFTIDSESNLTCSGKIDASGGDFDGGEIDLGAGGNVNVLATSNIDLQATQGGGSGGTLEIYGSSDQSEPVGGNVILGGSVDLSGDSDGDFGGDGGELDIGDSFTLVGGSITIMAPINASSGNGGGGGDVSFAAVSDISQSAAIQVQGKGTDGSGGTATFEAHHALKLNDIDATGDVLLGGEIDATAWCSLALPLGGTLDTTDGGSNNLASGGTMTITGTVRAIDGSNLLSYLNTSTSPAISGVVTPVAVVQPVGPLGDKPLHVLQACGTGPAPHCGDGILQPGEQCDDGNQVNGDGCDNNCTFTGCGNGIMTPPEECDDGNMIPGDGCSPTCKVERCGNGELDPGEQCDDGAAGSASCTPQCTLIPPPTCGNGTIDPGEQCDDGNTNNCDGCSSFCLIECGDGKIDCNEQCDDGNTAAGDGCSPACKLEVCGNGVVDPGEQCDDGNADNCDGCKSDCTTRASTDPCPTCTPDANDRNNCLPCSANMDCDPLQACGTSACIAGACTPVAKPNCDDGNPCTVDSCNPASGCTNNPKVVDDGNPCNGTETCDPASGQTVTGAPPNCDDGDACTTNDHCESNGAGAVCVTTQPAGQAGVTCRLNGVQQALNGASDLKKGTKKKIAKLLKQVQAKLPATTGTSKKAVKARKVVNARLQSLMKLLGKTKASASTLNDLRDAVTKAISALPGL
jgi:cysteine-rich repeat protein